MSNLKTRADGSITMRFLVIGAEKILRLLRLFFYPTFCVAMEFANAQWDAKEGRQGFWHQVD